MDDEEKISSIVHLADFAVDNWALANVPWRGTQAEYTHGIVDAAVRHLIEQGLLVVPDDIEERLSRPITVYREAGTLEEA